MMTTMPRRKKGSPPPEPLERETFLLPKSLFDALTVYIERQKFQPTKSAVMRMALEEFLERQGAWQPSKPTGLFPKSKKS